MKPSQNNKISCSSYNARSCASLRRLIRLVSAAIGATIALSAYSCKTSKRESLSHETLEGRTLHLDSTSHRVTLRTSHISLPKQSVTMTLPRSSLHNLPPGAGYHERSGRASLAVRTRGDTLILTAHCDSLEQRIEELTIEAERLTRLNAQLTSEAHHEVSKTSAPLKPPWWLAIITAILIALLLWLLVRKPSKWGL